MEPVGVAASFAGLLSLVIQTTQISVDFASKVLGASKAQTEYMRELQAVKSVLEKLNHAAAVPPGSVESYTTQIERFKAKLEKRLAKNGPLSGLKNLTWPFEEGEMAKVVEMLHRLQGILHASLSVDGL